MKNTFLGNVARSLYGRYGDGLSALTIVLPNRRSRLFLMEELSSVIERPMWQPRYASIDELMSAIAGIASADRVRLIAELYKVWRKYHDETFDKFYFWGETLLSDFDQIDKYLIDARALFTNISDLKSIGDELDYLDQQQRQVLARFWEAFSSEKQGSQERERFRTVWNSLGGVYSEFRATLEELGFGYTGMIHRIAAGKIKAGEVPPDDSVRYAVVGFNALTECEKALFDLYGNAGCADFFWDYDDYYLKDEAQEAGLFARHNVIRYPQARYFINTTDNFVKPKNIRALSLPSDSVQTRYAASFLEEIVARNGSAGKETAIVLTNEDLLVPLLYAIPESVGDVNVTMGYPLRQSLAYSFTERLLKLQSHARSSAGGKMLFYHLDVTGLLSHPYVAAMDRAAADRIRNEIVSTSRGYVDSGIFAGNANLEKIFTPHAEWDRLLEYVIDILSLVGRNVAAAPVENAEGRMQREFLGEIAETLRKLLNTLGDCGIGMTASMVSALARRMLQNIRIPYSGEPLKGVQIMGILETRNLDFENVLILSMNDDNFPGNPSASNSFIPYNLRFAYGLPTPQHHDGVYAYYFYRLLQRAENIDFTYSSTTSEDSSGELSRYIYQLEYESPHRIIRENISLDVNLAPPGLMAVEKTGNIAAILDQYLSGGRTISPSALNAYLDCPMKFCFRSVIGLRPPDEVAEEVDVAMFGSILHKAMELLYLPLRSQAGLPAKAASLIGSPLVREAVDRAISVEYFNGAGFSEEELSGNLILVRDIVARYINGSILRFDSGQEDFTVLSLEQTLEAPFDITVDDQPARIIFRGLADRVDRLADGRIRIVDYKTGSPHQDFAGIESLMGAEYAERNAAALQTLVYSLMASRMQERGELEGREVCPALYYVRIMNSEDYSPLLNHSGCGSVQAYSRYREELEPALRSKLEELFDVRVPFTQCTDDTPCRYCDYKGICRRG